MLQEVAKGVEEGNSASGGGKKCRGEVIVLQKVAKCVEGKE